QDSPATRAQKAKLSSLEASQVSAKTVGGEPVTSVLTSAPGNNAPIGGLKVTTENSWFAVRPSGTEDVYKIYAESLRDEDHLRTVQHDARTLVDGVLE
ncbi:MAG: phosphoglucomutase, alpha-D-glucose phosphate-specific, partial [Brevibacterium sp.]|nr:phosphoglucomutase, alpha-D-glucose phosphate-specific [Brevibacterium sp.]